MNTSRTITLAATTAALLATMSTGVANADSRHDVETVELNCDRLGTLEVVVSDQAAWAPALVVGTNQILIPYELHFVAIFTPIIGEPAITTEDHVKPQPRNGRTDHCTLHEEYTVDAGTVTFDGDLHVSYTR
jgi:hypothetical protein